MQRAHLFTALALVFSVAGCGTPPGPPVATVEVAGPAGGRLEIGKGTAFTAVAKGGDGAALPGKAFTWSSSNPLVAAVDAGGVVTARRFGTFTISATAEGKTGASAPVATYGLEIAGGTSVTTSQAGQVGTHFRYRFKTETDGAPTVGGAGQISGPAGWNNGNSAQITWCSGCSGTTSTLNRVVGSAPVSGTYTATLTFAGRTYRSTFAIDASQTLAPTSQVTLGAVTSSSVSASWAPVAGANSYWLFVVKDGSGPGRRTGDTSVTVSGLPLVKGGTYEALLVAETASANPADPLPEQANYAAHSVSFVAP